MEVPVILRGSYDAGYWIYGDEMTIESTEENLRLAHGYLALAQKHLYMANAVGIAHDIDVCMEEVRLDHAEGLAQCPVVSRK